jgi:hypothetical protein
VLVRRRIVLTLADARPGPAALLARRLLPWLVAQGVEPVLLLGDGGGWRPRLVGFGPVVAADAPDAWWAARLHRRLGLPRGLRVLRSLRFAWWRARLRGAPLLALSGPLHPLAEAALPRRARVPACAPRLPDVFPAAVQATNEVVGVGALDEAAGADLWIRVVHELHRRGVQGPFVWFDTGGGSCAAAFEHDRRHLGLTGVTEVRDVESGDDEVDALLDGACLLLTARPAAGDGGLPGTALPGVGRALCAGAMPVVSFAGSPSGSLIPAAEVPFPDVVALADAIESVLAGAATSETPSLADVRAAAWTS